MSVPVQSDSVAELIGRCLAGNEAAWIDFIARFQPAIALGAIKVARLYGDTAPDTIDDLIQQTYVKICADHCRRLRPFQDQPAAALGAYLRTMAANTARDHFSARYPEHMAIPLDGPSAREIVGSSDNERSFQSQLLVGQIDVHLSQIPSQNPSRDRLIFWLYYRTGLTAKAIAAIPAVGMTSKGVESSIQRMTAALRKSMTTENIPDDSKGNPGEHRFREGGSE